MVQRSGHCLSHELGEIEVSVKMPITRNGTERPREPLLQLHIVLEYRMCRIAGRLRSVTARWCGVVLEIPAFLYLGPNLAKTGDSVWWVV
jgi:hypothetical protein